MILCKNKGVILDVGDYWWLWLTQLVEHQALLCTTEWWAVRLLAGTIGLSVGNIPVMWGFMFPSLFIPKKQQLVLSQMVKANCCIVPRAAIKHVHCPRGER